MSDDHQNAARGSESLLAGKRIAITGASRGLGRAVALALGAHGASLVINARDQAALDALANEISAGGGTAVPVPGSAADEAVAERLVAACVSEFSGIDCLINNAGIVRDRTTLKMSAADFDDVVATNLRGTWLCGREAARAMKETGGHIINVVSNVAFHGSIGQANYAASKAGAAALTRAWSYELARYGIRANAVWPIAVTDMTQVVIDRMAQLADQRGEDPPSGAAIGLGDPHEVAKIFVFLASDLAAHLNHQIITFNGGRLALWTHPHEVGLTVRAAWTVDDIAACFSGDEALESQPMYELSLEPLPMSSAGLT